MLVGSDCLAEAMAHSAKAEPYCAGCVLRTDGRRGQRRQRLVCTKYLHWYMYYVINGAGEKKAAGPCTRLTALPCYCAHARVVQVCLCVVCKYICIYIYIYIDRRG